MPSSSVMRVRKTAGRMAESQRQAVISTDAHSTRGPGRFGEQLRDDTGAATQHGGRAERGFGRHLAAVERRRLGFDDDAHDAVRAAGAARGERIEHLLEARPDPRAREHAHRIGVGGQIGIERAAGGDVRKHQRGDERLPAAGDHHVERERRERSDRRTAQRSDVHPGAGGKFEVFGNAPVEAQAALGVIGVHERDRIAEAEVTLVVECGGSERGVVPIARRDAIAFARAARACR